jgi:RNA polymerase sigma-70 factor (ECF subfamily)
LDNVQGNRFAGMNFETALRLFADTVTRICKLHCSNEEDAKDCFQNTFLKLFKSKDIFQTEAHLKAWLITVTIHECADVYRQGWKKYTLLREDMNTLLLQKEELQQIVNEHSDDTLEKVLELPVKYRRVLYLYYYEQYSISEIAKMLSVSENTIKTQMARARKKLNNRLSGNPGTSMEMIQ